MKEKKKLDITNILVYIVMGLLILIIIFPPILRLMLPKDKPSINEKPKEVIMALTCSKTFPLEKIQEKVTINYNNDVLQKITFYYIKLEDEKTTKEVPNKIKEEQKEVPKVSEKVTVKDREDAFSKLENADVSGTDTSRTKIILTSLVVKNNVTNPLLSPFLGTKDVTEEVLKTDGYTCQVLS